MSAFIPLNPRPMLQSLVSKEVLIRIKWGQEYTGNLVSIDSYMNVQLSDTHEWKDGVDVGALGQVLIRCNNVLWISARGAAEENGDRMEE